MQNHTPAILREKFIGFCFNGGMFDEFLELGIIFQDSFLSLDFRVHVNKHQSSWAYEDHLIRKKTGLKIG